MFLGGIAGPEADPAPAPSAVASASPAAAPRRQLRVSYGSAVMAASLASTSASRFCGHGLGRCREVDTGLAEGRQECR